MTRARSSQVVSVRSRQRRRRRCQHSAASLLRRDAASAAAATSGSFHLMSCPPAHRCDQRC